MSIHLLPFAIRLFRRVAAKPGSIVLSCWLLNECTVIKKLRRLQNIKLCIGVEPMGAYIMYCNGVVDYTVVVFVQFFISKFGAVSQ